MKLLSQMGRLCVILAALGTTSCDPGPSKQELQDQRDREFRETTSRLHTLCYYHDDLGSLESVEACLELSRMDPRYDLIVLINRGLKQLPDSFQGLENLESLHLDGNTLSELPPSISLLTNLKMLTLYDNQFYELPKPIFDLDSLTTLSLGKNPIREIPDKISRLLALEALGLSNLENGVLLPDSLPTLTSLKLIELERTALKEIPKVLFKMEALEYLHLGATNVQTIPPEISHLKNLKGLTINDNQLTELPDSIGDLNNLIFLDARRNNINTIPGSIAHIPRLQINIENHDDYIGAGSLIQDWAHVTAPGSSFTLRRSGINIAANNIKRLPSAFCSVKYLDIDYNPLSKETFNIFCSGGNKDE